MDLLILLGISAVFLLIAYVIGSTVERNHYKDLRTWEGTFRDMVVVNFKTVPSDWKVERAELVCGSVVVSLDHFKRFLAGLRGFVGGPITSYESLLDRARREAIIRMKKEARKKGYHTIMNLRLETSCLASVQEGGKGTAGTEVLAFGTALKLLK